MSGLDDMSAIGQALTSGFARDFTAENARRAANNVANDDGDMGGDQDDPDMDDLVRELAALEVDPLKR